MSVSRCRSPRFLDCRNCQSHQRRIVRSSRAFAQVSLPPRTRGLYRPTRQEQAAPRCACPPRPPRGVVRPVTLRRPTGRATPHSLPRAAGLSAGCGPRGARRAIPCATAMRTLDRCSDCRGAGCQRRTRFGPDRGRASSGRRPFCRGLLRSRFGSLHHLPFDENASIGLGDRARGELRPTAHDLRRQRQRACR